MTRPRLIKIPRVSPSNHCNKIPCKDKKLRTSHGYQDRAIHKSWTSPLLKECYQNTVDQTGSYSEDMNENLAIFCGSDHLDLIDPVKGYFRDPLHSNKDIWGIVPASGSKQACSGNYQAFG